MLTHRGKRGLWIWGPALTMMILIFAFSAQPTLPEIGSSWQDFLVKKACHATEYAILALTYLWALENLKSPQPFSEPPKRFGIRPGLLLQAWGMALLYAATDELHQLLVPGRHGRLMDWGIDALGAAIGLLILNWWRRRSPPAA